MVSNRVGQYICKSCRHSAKTRLFPIRFHRQASTRARPGIPDVPARTRFAPSPTGNLHLGSVRTALFNYLLAKRTKGQFILRIEDTDRKRTISGAEERLYQDLKWAGLTWDEGPDIGGQYEPYRQSERTSIYQKHLKTLLESRHAYRCFCSEEHLDLLNQRRHENGLRLGYDRTCAYLSPDESDEKAHGGQKFVVRLKVSERAAPWEDLALGSIGQPRILKHQSKPIAERFVFDDPIMIKSDGLPTYHFANVVDDHLMKITHVLRGTEWMASTPIHLQLYEALGWKAPLFGHVPLLVDKNNQKLSKRNLDTDISSFRDEQGINPEAFLNFAVLLGWSHPNRSDFLPLPKLEEMFDLKFTQGNVIVSLEKLDWMQRQYSKKCIQEGGPDFQNMVAKVCAGIREFSDKEFLDSLLGARDLKSVIARLVQADAKSFSTSAAFARRLAALFQKLPPSDPTGFVGNLSGFHKLYSMLNAIPEDIWTADTLREEIKSDSGTSSISTSGLSKKEVFVFLRWALTRGDGPPVLDIMEALGKEVCVDRIKSGLDYVQNEGQAEALPNAAPEPAS